MKKLIILVMFISSLQAQAGLKITSFNLKWFGTGGELSGKSSDEYRGPWITEFINKYLIASDIILFQEVVDTKKLISLLGNLKYECQTYEGSGSRHQHLVLCHRAEFKFIPERDDDNLIFEDIASINNSKLRPAISGVITNAKSGEALLHILGVHLKAGRLEGQMREMQTQLLAGRILSFKDKTPVVVLGDFNTYPKEISGSAGADLEKMDELYEQADLKRVMHDFRYTFKSFNYGHLFDHFWISNKLNIQSVDVFQACNTTNSKLYRYRNTSFYNRFVYQYRSAVIR